MVGIEVCEMRNFFCCVKLVVSSVFLRIESCGFYYIIDFFYFEESKGFLIIIFFCFYVNNIWSLR